MKRIYVFAIVLLANSIIIKMHNGLKAQSLDDNALKLSGELLTDERFLLEDKNDWAWNETRLTINLDKKIAGNSKFYSEIWLRNIGLPNITTLSDLYNKGIVDPYNMEIRQAYVQLNEFLTKNMDLSIGRQKIAWGTADKLNPTSNLNPYDMEDILDFGRHRGSDAIRLNYYFNYDFSLQGVFIPFFQPANMPIGIFSDALNPGMNLSTGTTLRSFSDTVLMPRYSLTKSSTSGLKFKGFVSGVDFSISYVNGIDGLPENTRNNISFADTIGGININVNSELSFVRLHIFGADLATSIAGVGFWAEAALFKPVDDIFLINDKTLLYSALPIAGNSSLIKPVTSSVILDKNKFYLKYIIGGDYFFADGSYLNLQYMHGFIHEKGKDNLNDYFFLQYEKRFFNEKLKIAPISGAFIITNWKDLGENYAIAYMPQIAYNATVNSEISISTAIFDGKGDSMFANLKDFNMFMLKMKYSF